MEESCADARIGMNAVDGGTTIWSDDDVETDIQGYDIDGEVIKAAQANAREAGVDHLIHFQQRSVVSELRHPKKYGFMITNPPYGERLEERANLPALYTEIGRCVFATFGQLVGLCTDHFL